MNRQQAVRFALEELKKNQRKFAVEANIYSSNPSVHTTLKKAYDKYMEFDECMRELEAIGAQREMKI